MKIASLTLGIASLLVFAAPAPAVMVSEPASVKNNRSYAQMSEAERVAYVSARAETIAQMLVVEGEKPVAVSADGVRAIKERLDKLAARSNSKSNVPGSDDIAVVFARATKAAPVVARAFKSAGLPAAYGLYIALIESEYNDCLTSRLGSKGVFQFLPSTGEKYGLGPNDYCDLEKSANAAARYIVDRRAEFASNDAQAVFTILSYNVGSKYIKGELLPVIDAAGGDVTSVFWGITADPSRFDLAKDFGGEGRGYLPSFFAAAIVGENPADFGLGGQPLSSLQ
jgi:hypothetical protein